MYVSTLTPELMYRTIGKVYTALNLLYCPRGTEGPYDQPLQPTMHWTLFASPPLARMKSDDIAS